MKKIISIVLTATMSFTCLIPVMGQGSELEQIDTYMQNVVETTKSPFLQHNLESNQTRGSQDVEYVSDELSIEKYNIENGKQVYASNEDFADKLVVGDVSINYQEYSWYIPALNGENKKTTIIFDDYNGDLVPVAMSITQNTSSPENVLEETEINTLIKENDINFSELIYFNMPIENELVVSTYIETLEGEKYIMVIDNTIRDTSIDIGRPYKLNELSELIVG